MDPADNQGPTAAARAFTIDTVAPQTVIDSGPSGTTSNSSPVFAFSSEAGARFECRMDAGAWVVCASPYSYTGLVDGEHTFTLRVTDAAGNTDATPATRAFTVTLLAPAPSPVPRPGPAGPTTAPATTDADGDGPRNDWLVPGHIVRAPKAPTAAHVGAHPTMRLALPKRPTGAKLRVYVRATGGKFPTAATTTRRAATIRGLKPLTRYEFKVGRRRRTTRSAVSKASTVALRVRTLRRP